MQLRGEYVYGWTVVYYGVTSNGEWNQETEQDRKAITRNSFVFVSFQRSSTSYKHLHSLKYSKYLCKRSRLLNEKGEKALKSLEIMHRRSTVIWNIT